MDVARPLGTECLSLGAMMIIERSGGVARTRLAGLRLDLEARAAGYWWVAGDWLELVAFVASPALAEEVSTGFVEASRSVSLERVELGFVKAVVTGEVAVSGSSYWLRAFGADRSIAVPLHDQKGAIRAVIAVALVDGALGDDEVVEQIVTIARSWAPFLD